MYDPTEAINNLMRGNIDTFLFSGVPANISIAVSAIENNVIDERHRWDDGIIVAVCVRIATGRDPNRSFMQNRQYRATMDAVIDVYQLARSTANEQTILYNTAGIGIDFGNVQAVLDRVAEEEVISKLARSAEFENSVIAAHGADQRASIRAQKLLEMSQGGTKHFDIKTPNGQSGRYDAQGRIVEFSSSGGRRRVDPVSDEEVDELYSQWKMQQHYKSMTKEQLRAVVKAGTQSAYEQKFHAHAGTHEPIRPVSEPLFDPWTNEPIADRKSLIRFINSRVDAAKTLLMDKQGRVNQARKTEFERILNSRS